MLLSKYLKFNNTHSKLEAFVWCILITTITFYLSPILANEYPAGWDLTGHYYLFNKMIDLITQGKLHGYDVNWFSGYQAFILYSPLSYLIIAVIYFLTFGLVSKLLVFNIFVFLVPIFFLLSLRYALLKCLGRKYVWIGLLVSTTFLFFPMDYAHSGLGLAGIVFMGFVPQYIAICFFLLFFAKLKGLKEDTGFKEVLVLSILFSTIVYSHLLTTIFAAFVLFIYLLFNIDAYKKILIFSLLVIVFTFPWMYQFFMYLPYSSGVAIGIERFKGYKDPLQLLFPRIEVLKNLSHVYIEDRQINFSIFKQLLLSIKINTKFIFFPYTGVSLIFACLAGCYAMIRQKLFIVWVFVISLIILPRNFLLEVIDLSIHYYRFATYLFILNIFIATFGIVFIYRYIDKNLSNKHFVKMGSRLIVSMLLVLALFQQIFFSLEWDKFSYYGSFGGSNLEYKLLAKGYKNYDEVESVVGYFKNNTIKGRVIVEATGDSIYDLGSPHLISTMLPLEAGVNVLPGLITESSISTGFINPVLATQSDHMAWGHNPYREDYHFNSQSIDDAIRRLRLYGVEYIVAVTDKFYNRLLHSKNAQLVKKYKAISVFKLNKFRKKVISIKTKPFLFVDNGGSSFRTFSEHWYRYPELFNYPVIYSRKNYSDLSVREKDKIAGVIISNPGDQLVSVSEFKKWKSLHKKFIFINAKPPKGLMGKGRERFISALHLNHSKFKDVYLRMNKSRVKFKSIDYVETANNGILEEISFSSKKNVIINYNYDICWKSEDSDQEVYQVTPSQMFVFANGVTRLICN